MALLELSGVSREFPAGRGRTLRAVDDVTLSVEEGEVLGLVGESGCGKSTLARCIVGLHPASAGTISFDDEPLATRGKAARARTRDLVMVFQDPFASLNPRRRVRDIVAGPLDIHGLARGAERTRRVGEMLELVGLDAGQGGRYPHEFSGGQRQRIGLARALITRPRLVVCDEPVSALDVSVQAQILNLLTRLREELSLTLVFIAHDLGVVRHVSDRVAVMYLGRIVETAGADALFAAPRHPYTAALLDAVPIPDPALRPDDDAILAGDVPSLAATPSGCRFHPRCPRAQDDCRADEPALAGDAHAVACLHPLVPSARL